MKLRAITLALWLITSFAWSDNHISPYGLSSEYPTDGRMGIIYGINTNTYVIEVSGYDRPVYRAAKIFNTNFERIFLFQIPLNSGVIMIQDDKGVITEIWMLPKNFEVPIG